MMAWNTHTHTHTGVMRCVQVFKHTFKHTAVCCSDTFNQCPAVICVKLQVTSETCCLISPPSALGCRPAAETTQLKPHFIFLNYESLLAISLSELSVCEVSRQNWGQTFDPLNVLLQLQPADIHMKQLEPNAWKAFFTKTGSHNANDAWRARSLKPH